MDKRNILLVEDNRKDELLAIRALRQNSIVNQIDVARDGQEALDYLLDPDREPPAIVILDLKLPKIDGHQVLREIRGNNRTQRLPVIILTSSDEESDISGAYENGVNGFVCKPVNINDFKTAVRDLARYWLHVNRSTC